MVNPNTQCAHCGHAYYVDNPYYSEDFAAYFSRRPIFSLRWCFNCSHVLTYRATSVFIRMIGGPHLRFNTASRLETVDQNSFWHKKDPALGLFAGAHLMRMVWHCLNARAAVMLGSAEDGDASNRRRHPEFALELAMSRLPPREVALMVAMTVHESQIIPREQRIQEGTSLHSGANPWKTRSWISSLPDGPTKEETLRLFDCYLPDYSPRK